MASTQTSTKRWGTDARGRRVVVSETTGRDLGSTTDYQDTGGLAAASRAAKAKAKKKAVEDETTEDQADALAEPRKRKSR